MWVAAAGYTRAMRDQHTDVPPGLELIDPLTFGPEQRCFGCGPGNRIGMNLRFYRDGDEVVTWLRAQEGWEGPPGVLHGGLQATLADEVGAWTVVGLRGRFGFTTSLRMRFLRPARVDAPIEARGRITAESEGMVTVAVTLRQGEKNLARGQASFVIPTVEMAEKSLGMPLPESWRRLARSGDS